MVIVADCWTKYRILKLGLIRSGLAQDLTANLGQLTVHLKKFCDLKTVKDMVEEKERINKQVVDDLVKTVDKKNDVVASQHHQFVVLRNMVNEVDALRVKAEEEKKKMEEQHKRGELRCEQFIFFFPRIQMSRVFHVFIFA
jgi:hypothetical protein